MYKTLIYYNYRNNEPLSNENIKEAMHKSIELESILDANNVTADDFSHTSNTQRESVNAIIPSEKINKYDNLEDTLNNLTINNAEYYLSISSTTNETKSDHASNPKKVTCTSDGKGKFTETRNGIIKAKGESVYTRGSRVRPIIVRHILERI